MDCYKQWILLSKSKKKVLIILLFENKKEQIKKIKGGFLNNKFKFLVRKRLS